MSASGRPASSTEPAPPTTSVPSARSAPSGPRPERPAAPRLLPVHPVDRAFLNLERARPDVRWDAGGVAYLSGPPPALADLRAYFGHRLRALPLMTSRIEGGRRPRWQPDEGFDVDRHVHEAVADGPGGWDAALHTALNAPFAPGTYWGAWLVHGHDPDAYALCYRFHHACQDGAAAAMTFRAVLGEGEASGRPVPGPGRRAAVPRRAAAAVGLAARFAAGTVAVRGHRPVAAYVPTGERRLYRGRVPSDTLRRIGAARDGSAHDAYLAALAGALAAWADESEVPLPRVTAVLPVDARRPDEEQTWGNRCFALPLELPVRLAPADASSDGDALRRLDHVTTATRKLRGAARRQTIVDLVRHMPARPTEWYMRRVLSPRVTNVMTTSMPLADRGGLGETRVTGTALLPLLVPGHLFAVALSFFGEWAEVSVVVDRGLPRGERLPELWERAVAELEEAASR
ncbi:wax ester/triacylglycerol synthase domain-containing protein [Streptomyces sp. NBC_01789]|uniref:wax ester/triacylglycerol synthase domain-containing protein n=1 Tax=unclassified Streptomyces TaxID=2593676 RepID=UPI00224ED2BD|nr:wax ester/triacylglycerol synthase domain-containing protein [Streptomyces sp. NBC_01789]MCX4445107.1 wax ester/triacylglycerol synthase family O-acyltransferase [Streptomyces sp. NBC_01789]